MRFTCLPGCTECCRQPGYVYLSEADVPRMAARLGMTAAAFESRYVYRTRYRLRLRKPANGQCPFLNETGCSVHPDKPVQCGAFPFWPEVLDGELDTSYCPGIGQGDVVPLETLRASCEDMRTAYPAMYAPPRQERTASQRRTRRRAPKS